jgi:protein-arginine kinase activator protein McsA
VTLNTQEDGLKNFKKHLKFRLDKALAHEEYELAARLRDELAGIGSNEFSTEE